MYQNSTARGKQPAQRRELVGGRGNPDAACFLLLQVDVAAQQDRPWLRPLPLQLHPAVDRPWQKLLLWQRLALLSR
jgi:hypothetical protein